MNVSPEGRATARSPRELCAMATTRGWLRSSPLAPNCVFSLSARPVSASRTVKLPSILTAVIPRPSPRNARRQAFSELSVSQRPCPLCTSISNTSPCSRIRASRSPAGEKTACFTASSKARMGSSASARQRLAFPCGSTCVTIAWPSALKCDRPAPPRYWVEVSKEDVSGNSSLCTINRFCPVSTINRLWSGVRCRSSTSAQHPMSRSERFTVPSPPMSITALLV